MNKSSNFALAMLGGNIKKRRRDRQGISSFPRKDGLDWIQSMPASRDTVLRLGKLFGHVNYMRTAYNFSNLEPGLTDTVEFRQFEGCMDGDIIGHWIRTVCGIVEFAEAIDTKYIDALCRAHLLDVVQDGDYTLEQFLNEIGVPVQAAFWKKRVEERGQAWEDLIVVESIRTTDVTGDVRNLVQVPGWLFKEYDEATMEVYTC